MPPGVNRGIEPNRTAHPNMETKTQKKWYHGTPVPPASNGVKGAGQPRSTRQVTFTVRSFSVFGARCAKGTDPGSPGDSWHRFSGAR